MKVILINGSPKINGNTFATLNYLSENLNNNGIETEIYNLGDKNIKPCTACSSCYKTRDKKCILKDDLNDLILKCEEADGIVLASPVHYADITALAKCAYDRLFYVSGANRNFLKHKVGAAIAVVRRAGGVPAFNTLNAYLSYSEMFIVGSSYWNVVYGQLPNQVLKDGEGLQTIATLGDNMSYLLNVLDQTSVEKPEYRKKVMTNFVRDDL